MKIPKGPLAILHALTEHQHEAFVVGGCVRDTLLGRIPGDWDVCTSALPEQVQAIFPKTIATGIAHGTVTVLLDGVGYEVTTFRSDGAYTDHRKPEQVTFVSSLEEDLLRRDFTVNAMAMDKWGKLYDPWGGQADLSRKLLRAVGDPQKRFEEDALRILRGLRFSAQLGFSIEEDTARAMAQTAHLLTAISGERVYQELCKLIMGACRKEVLLKYPHILAVVLPEIEASVGFSQHNPHHHLSVWEHTVETVEHTPEDLLLRWTMLLHDLGKPETFSLDENGVGHFYDHAEKSAGLADHIFRRLHSDNLTRQLVVKLIAHHGDMLPQSKKTMRRMLQKWTEEELRSLLGVKQADIMGLHPDFRAEALASLRTSEQLLEETLQEQPCVSIKALAISGDDLLELGVEKGPRVGALLHHLLEDVMEERTENSRHALLARARTLLGKDTL